jgi:hypothetical protein
MFGEIRRNLARVDQLNEQLQGLPSSLSFVHYLPANPPFVTRSTLFCRSG